MADFSCDIVVVGAGVLGLCVASELTARGRDVRVVDPGEANASSVAAGMIAPAGESILEGASSDRAELLYLAAQLWPAFAKRHGLRLDRTLALWAGELSPSRRQAIAEAGIRFEPSADGLEVDDMQVDTGRSLSRLAAGLVSAPVSARVRAIARSPGGWTLSTDRGTGKAKCIVLATGAAPPIEGLPISVVRVIDRVEPIAGQIGTAPVRLTDRVVRGAAGYVAPGPDETTLIGATMVAGERDPRPNREAGHRLLSMAEKLLGRPLPQAVEWRVAVRGASPDGLPMAGPTEEPSIHVALAPRRNGWLLGPMVARVVADGIEGRPRDRYAAAFDPLRFSSRAG